MNVFLLQCDEGGCDDSKDSCKLSDEYHGAIVASLAASLTNNANLSTGMSTHSVSSQYFSSLFIQCIFSNVDFKQNFE